MEWFNNIPTDGILCKCKQNKKNGRYKIDIITRYNDQINSNFRFKNSDIMFIGYVDAIPLTSHDATKLIYRAYDND